MSNYKPALAVANHPEGKLFTPEPEHPWWKSLSAGLQKRYDVSEIDKWRLGRNTLPLVMSIQGERSFQSFARDLEIPRNAEAELRRLQEDAGPDTTCPVHGWSNPRADVVQLWRSYGGDYWLWSLWRCRDFWEGLHKAGTRGVYVIETGSEYSVEYDGYVYECTHLYWYAWFLVVADLRGNQVVLDYVYDDPSYVDSLRASGGEGRVYMHERYAGSLMQHALGNPRREGVVPDRVPWGEIIDGR
jgi:hypothetical protein